MSDKTAIREAIDRLGGVQQTARLMGVSDTAVRKWICKDSVPVNRLAKFAVLAERPAGDFNPAIARLRAARV